jgi:hypothetical protein
VGDEELLLVPVLASVGDEELLLVHVPDCV